MVETRHRRADSQPRASDFDHPAHDSARRRAHRIGRHGRKALALREGVGDFGDAPAKVGILPLDRLFTVGHGLRERRFGGGEFLAYPDLALRRGRTRLIGIGFLGGTIGRALGAPHGEKAVEEVGMGLLQRQQRREA